MSELPARAPQPNHETQYFWDATAAGRLELQRCTSCSLAPWPPRSVCPDCQSASMDWQVHPGTGTVYSFSVTRAGVGRAWKEHLPFVIAYVQLDDGPTVLTNIVDCDPDAVTIGMTVTAVFDDTGEGSSIIRFTPTSVTS